MLKMNFKGDLGCGIRNAYDLEGLKDYPKYVTHALWIEMWRESL